MAGQAFQADINNDPAAGNPLLINPVGPRPSHGADRPYRWRITKIRCSNGTGGTRYLNLYPQLPGDVTPGSEQCCGQYAYPHASGSVEPVVPEEVFIGPFTGPITMLMSLNADGTGDPGAGVDVGIEYVVVL